MEMQNTLKKPIRNPVNVKKYILFNKRDTTRKTGISGHPLGHRNYPFWSLNAISVQILVVTRSSSQILFSGQCQLLVTTTQRISDYANVVTNKSAISDRNFGY